LYLVQSFIYLNTYLIFPKFVVIFDSFDDKLSVLVNILPFFLVGRKSLGEDSNVLDINRVAFSFKTTRFNHLTCAKRQYLQQASLNKDSNINLSFYEIVECYSKQESKHDCNTNRTTIVNNETRILKCKVNCDSYS